MFESTEVLVLGAGPAGLSAAYHAQLSGLKAIVLEARDHVGGLCSTKVVDGFHFDYSGHLLHLKDPYFKRLVQSLLGDNLVEIARKAVIYSNGVFTPYPFQANLFGLPAGVVQECLISFAKAYFTQEDLPTSSYPTFRAWVDAKLGEGIGRHFMYPYNEKLWTVPADAMTCDWMSEYVPKPDIEAVFRGALGPSTETFGYNATFLYPKVGGIQALADALAARLDDIRLGDPAVAIDLTQRWVRTASGRQFRYERLVSTLPLNQLPLLLDPVHALALEEDRKALRHNGILIVNLGLKGAGMTDKHWIYLPEKRFTPYRIGVYSNFLPSLAPPGTTSYYLEIAYSPSRPVDKQALVEESIEQLKEIDLLRDTGQILVKDVRDVPCAYVIHDATRPGILKRMQAYLSEHDVTSIGRYGNWEYSGMEEALAHGRKVIADAYPGRR